jgi:hypothetical protein
MADRLEILHERVVQLEAREQVILARAEAAALTSSTYARDKELGDLRERILRIEIFLNANSSVSQTPVLITKDGIAG